MGCCRKFLNRTIFFNCFKNFKFVLGIIESLPENSQFFYKNSTVNPIHFHKLLIIKNKISRKNFPSSPTQGNIRINKTINLKIKKSHLKNGKFVM
jgi:hypothetical protein